MNRTQRVGHVICCNAIVGLGCVVLLASDPVWATDYTNVAASGAWNAGATWTPSTDYPRLAGDTATIASNTVTSGTNVIPIIQLINVTSTGGRTGILDIAANVWQTAPVQLNGGTFKLDYTYPNACLISNALTVKADSQIYALGNGNGAVLAYSDLYGPIQDWVQGGVTNTGKIWVTGDNQRGYINVRGNGTGFSGGWDVTGGSAYPGGPNGANGARNVGGLVLYSDGGLGSGTVMVHTTLRLWSNQSGSSAVPPPARIVVQPAYDVAGVWLGVDNFTGNFAVTNWNMDFYGGALAFSDQNSSFSGGILNVYSNMLFTGKRDGRWTASSRYGGEIRGPGRITINPYWFDSGYGNSSAAFYLYGNNTNFAGGVTLLGNNLYVQHPNALGTGDCWFAAGDAGTVYLQNAAGAANWTLGNNIGGINTLRVENGTAYALTLAGSTLQPGTNVNAAGKLTIAGSLQLSTNAAGGYAKLIVDVTGAGGVAGVDYDQLVVTRAGLAGTLGQCDLVINLGPTVEQLSGQSLTIVINTNDNFTGQSFHSVTWQNVKGVVQATNVIYNNGSIQLQIAPADPVISNQGGASGITSNSATLGGYLSVTGNAPTVVTVFWGTQDMGKTPVGWGGSQVLGTNTVGSVAFTPTGLTPDTTYFYRYYATNACGDCWADPAAGFVTMPNYSQFSYRMKIQFPGYTRGESLTNFRSW